MYGSAWWLSPTIVVDILLIYGYYMANDDGYHMDNANDDGYMVIMVIYNDNNIICLVVEP